MKDKQTTTKGFAILSTAGVINKLLALVYLPIQTMIVGNYGNGIINSGYTIYLLFFGLSNAGIPVAVSKLISENNAVGNYKNSQRILKASGVIMLVSSIIAAAIMALGANWISQNYCHEPKAYLMILALCPALLFTSVSSIFRGYFQGRLNMIPTAISQVIEQAINSVLTIVFAALLIKYGVEYAAAGTTIGTSIGALSAAIFLAVHYILKKKRLSNELVDIELPQNISSYTYLFKQILSYSLPSVFGIIAITLNSQIDLTICVPRLAVAGFNNVDAVAMYGILTNQYQRILNVPLAIMASLPAALIPAISTVLALKNREMLYNKINESFRMMLLISLPASAGLAILAKPIITLIFLHNNQGADLMVIGSWVIILNSILYVQNSVLIVAGKPLMPPINLTIGMIIKAILNYLLIGIPMLNIKGAVIASIIGFLVAVVLNNISIYKYVGIKTNYLKLIKKPAISSIVMSMMALGTFYLTSSILKNFIVNKIILSDVCIILSVGIASMSYLLTMLFIKGIVSEDIKKLPLGNTINRYMVKLKLIKDNIM